MTWAGRVKKYLDLTISDDAFSYARKTDGIAAEAAIDGLYVVRTTAKIPGPGERAFRRIKTVDLNVRPVYHWLERRAHLEWHMRRCLAPMLFDDADKEEVEALRRSVVAQAQRSKVGGEEANHRHDRRRTAGRTTVFRHAGPDENRLRQTRSGSNRNR